MRRTWVSSSSKYSTSLRSMSHSLDAPLSEFGQVAGFEQQVLRQRFHAHVRFDLEANHGDGVFLRAFRGHRHLPHSQGPFINARLKEANRALNGPGQFEAGRAEPLSASQRWNAKCQRRRARLWKIPKMRMRCRVFIGSF